MRKTRTETRAVEVVETITCNGCGETPPSPYAEMIRIYHCGGYDSILGDGDSYDFDLCESCLKKLMDGLKIPPTVNDEAEAKR